MQMFPPTESRGTFKRLKDVCGLNAEDIAVLSGEITPPFSLAEHFIENAIGFFSLPLRDGHLF